MFTLNNDSIVTVLQKNGIEILNIIPYQEIRKIYPRYASINDLLNSILNQPQIPDSTQVVVTPIAQDYMEGIDSAQTLTEMELHFEKMFYEAREVTIMTRVESVGPIPEEILELSRQKYSEVLDACIRPILTKTLSSILNQ